MLIVAARVVKTSEFFAAVDAVKRNVVTRERVAARVWKAMFAIEMEIAWQAAVSIRRVSMVLSIVPAVHLENARTGFLHREFRMHSQRGFSRRSMPRRWIVQSRIGV